MRWLKEKQYHVCIPDGVSPTSGSGKIVLTFDDGEMNNYEQAFGVLKKYGFPAYFFIIADRIGLNGYLGWGELKELHEAGMVIGSHGFSHEILTNLLDTQIDEELQASKKYLERNLGIVVDTISIPRGFCDDNIIQRAYNAGYKRIFISERPHNLQSDCHSRIAVKSSWSLKRFQQALDGNTPLNERVVHRGKNAVKRMFGGGAYNWVRRVLLKFK